MTLQGEYIQNAELVEIFEKIIAANLDGLAD